jgi:hypothetical protein
MTSYPTPIQEWQAVDANLFEKTIKPLCRPAILRGLAGDWPATVAGRRSPEAMSDYLKSFYDGKPAPLFEAPASIRGRFFYNDRLDGFNFESKRALLSEVLDRLCHSVGDPAAPALYSGSVSLPIYLPRFSSAPSRCWNPFGLGTTLASRRILIIPIISPASLPEGAASPCSLPNRSAISTWDRSI